MERRLNKVKKWLDRCIMACRSSSWENAVADMECAKAELEDARSELWAILDGSRAEKKRRKLFRPVEVLVASMVFVMVAAIPLSMPDQVAIIKRSIAWEDEALLLEIVTPDEKKILSSLRRSLSESNLASLDNKEPLQEVTSPERRSFVADKVQTSRIEEVPVDQVIELIEIGQRALKKNDSLLVVRD